MPSWIGARVPVGVSILLSQLVWTLCLADSLPSTKRAAHQRLADRTGGAHFHRVGRRAERSPVASRECGPRLVQRASRMRQSAAQWFKLLYLDSTQRDFPNNGYQSRVDEKLNRCFARVASSPIEDASLFPWIYSLALFDVRENRGIGRFTWSIEARQEPTTMRCEFNGQRCRSMQEWNALAQPYVGKRASRGMARFGMPHRMPHGL
jgi:hypothetical protein